MPSAIKTMSPFQPDICPYALLTLGSQEREMSRIPQTRPCRSFCAYFHEVASHHGGDSSHNEKSCCRIFLENL